MDVHFDQAVSPKESDRRPKGPLVLVCWCITIAAAALALALNRESEGQSGVTAYFLDIADVIRAGFDPAAASRRGIPTFPMWGYSWLMLAMPDRWPRLVFQNALALVVIALLLRMLANGPRMDQKELTAIRILFAFSLPWFAFQSVPWEQGVAGSLTVAGSALLAASVSARHRIAWPLVGSGIAFGLASNFRSDILLLPLVLASVWALSLLPRRRAAGACAAWLVCAYLPLVPWGLYTRNITGQFLLSSTNSGQVSTISFGVVPDNPWGITVSDEDPHLRRMVEERFGPGARPLSLECDRFLNARFREMVKEAPGVYLHKVLSVSVQQLLGGAYSGEFVLLLAPGEAGTDEYLRGRAELLTRPLKSLRTHPREAGIIAAQLFSGLLAKLVVLVSFCVLPLTFWSAWRARSGWYLCLLIPILYKAATVSLLAWAQPRFTSAVYPLHLVNAVAGSGIAFRFLADRVRRPA